jgi:hypothetical protein
MSRRSVRLAGGGCERAESPCNGWTKSLKLAKASLNVSQKKKKKIWMRRHLLAAPVDCCSSSPSPYRPASDPSDPVRSLPKFTLPLPLDISIRGRSTCISVLFLLYLFRFCDHGECKVEISKSVLGWLFVPLSIPCRRRRAETKRAETARGQHGPITTVQRRGRSCSIALSVAEAKGAP